MHPCKGLLATPTGWRIIRSISGPQKLNMRVNFIVHVSVSKKVYCYHHHQNSERRLRQGELAESISFSQPLNGGLSFYVMEIVCKGMQSASMKMVPMAHG